MNTIEPSAVPPKRQRVQFRQRLHNATMPIPLSSADALECHVKHSP